MSEQEQQGVPPAAQPQADAPAAGAVDEVQGAPAAPEPLPMPPVPEQPVPAPEPVPDAPAPEQPLPMPPVPDASEAPAPDAPAPEQAPAPEPAQPVPPMPGQPPVPPAAGVPDASAPEQPPAVPQQPAPTPEQNPWNGQVGAGYTQPASWQIPQQQTAPQQPPAYAQPDGSAPGAPTQPAPQPPAPPAKKSNTGIIVGGIVGVLLVAVALILVLVVIPGLSEPSASTGDVTYDEPMDDPADEPAPSYSDEEVPEDSEEQATLAAQTELDKLQNADPEALALVGAIVNEGFENQTDETLEACGVDPEEYARIMLDGFSYTIDDVYVYESIGEATVYATVTCRDVFDLIDNYNYMLEAYMDSDDFAHTTYEEDCQRMGMIFIEAAQSADMNDGYQMTIDLVYENGSWVVDEDAWESELDWLFDVE